MTDRIAKIVSVAGVGERAKRLLARLRAHPFRVRDGPADKFNREGPPFGGGLTHRSRWGPIHGPPRCREGPSNETESMKSTETNEEREDTTMSTNKQLRPGGLLFAMLLGLVMSPSAWAATTAGTNITNTASVDYTVATVNQTDITSNTDDFEVDRLLDLNVVVVSTPVNVTPGATARVRAFDVTNQGNAIQDVLLTAVDVVTDDFDEAIAIYVDTDGNNVRDGGDTLASTIDNLAIGGTRRVYLESNINGSRTNGQTDGVNLTAQVAETTGAAIATDDFGNADTQGTVDDVFGDPVTSGDNAADIIRDGFHSDDAYFLVASAEITLAKSSAVITDPVVCTVAGDPTSCIGGSFPKRIPGAVVRYTITVANAATASATADDVVITDGVPANTTYVTDPFGAPTSSLYESADATCNTADTNLTDAVAGDDNGVEAAGNITFGSTSVDLAAGAALTFCYDVTIN